jgi:hypothetical protein
MELSNAPEISTLDDEDRDSLRNVGYQIRIDTADCPTRLYSSVSVLCPMKLLCVINKTLINYLS